MGDIFFIADTHFNHSNIIRYCGRPFSDVAEMNHQMVRNWNQVVKPEDIVYCLGDFGYGDVRSIFDLLKGEKVLLKGCHDKRNVLDLDWRGHWDTYDLKVGAIHVWLSHYPHRSWKRSFHGSWHLYGHVHGRLEPWGLSFDVGVDAKDFRSKEPKKPEDFRPVSFSEVAEKMNYLKQFDRPMSD